MSSTAEDSTAQGQDQETPWPPQFPHRHIDALVSRLERAGELDAADANRLLVLVGEEAQRLRTTVVRLSAARLSAAQREANAIVADAHSHAENVRAVAMEVLVHRLDEAEALMSALRHTFPEARLDPGVPRERP